MRSISPLVGFDKNLQEKIPNCLFWGIGYVQLGLIHICDLLGMNYCKKILVHAIVKKGTQPVIQIFSPHKSGTNSKCEFSHLQQHNPLFSEWFRQ